MTIDELVDTITTSYGDRKAVLEKAATARDPEQAKQFQADLLGYVADDGLFLMRLANTVRELASEVTELRKL